MPRGGFTTDWNAVRADVQTRIENFGLALPRLGLPGEPGWDIVDELKPRPGEIVLDKPGKGSFYATDLDLLLRARGISHLIITGITPDVCVHTTMRDANDRGYECLLLQDCTGATDEGNYRAAIKMVKMQGGVFGSVSSSREVIEALRPLTRP
jgi:nicotinamidase-related amidase